LEDEKAHFVIRKVGKIAPAVPTPTPIGQNIGVAVPTPNLIGQNIGVAVPTPTLIGQSISQFAISTTLQLWL